MRNSRGVGLGVKCIVQKDGMYHVLLLNPFSEVDTRHIGEDLDQARLIYDEIRASDFGDE